MGSVTLLPPEGLLAVTNFLPRREREGLAITNSQMAFILIGRISREREQLLTHLPRVIVEKRRLLEEDFPSAISRLLSQCRAAKRNYGWLRDRHWELDNMLWDSIEELKKARKLRGRKEVPFPFSGNRLTRMRRLMRRLLRRIKSNTRECLSRFKVVNRLPGQLRSMGEVLPRPTAANLEGVIEKSRVMVGIYETKLLIYTLEAEIFTFNSSTSRTRAQLARITSRLLYPLQRDHHLRELHLRTACLLSHIGKLYTRKAACRQRFIALEGRLKAVYEESRAVGVCIREFEAELEALGGAATVS